MNRNTCTLQKCNDDDGNIEGKQASAAAAANTTTNTTNPSTTTTPLREFLDSAPEAIDGFLSYRYGFCAPGPLQKLSSSSNHTNASNDGSRSSSPSYGLWEEWAQKLPELYRTGRYREYFATQPILSTDALADEDLLRANQILGICAHAVFHFSEEEEEATTNAHCSPGGWITERLKIPEEKKSHQHPPDASSTNCPFHPVPGPPVTASSSAAAGNNNETTTTTCTKQQRRRSESRIPKAILHPWKAVNARLGRLQPTFTYYDYFTLNVIPADGDRGQNFDVPRKKSVYHGGFRCDVQVFGDRSENVFVLMNHDMEFQSIPLVSLACDAVDCVLQGHDEDLAEILNQMRAVITRVTDTFRHADPNPYSDFYCDPVSWSKSIGMLIPPIMVRFSNVYYLAPTVVAC